jgi:hypothetical protein
MGAMGFPAAARDKGKTTVSMKAMIKRLIFHLMRG